MLNSLCEWGERRSTRVFALKIAQKRLEFEGVCTVMFVSVIYSSMFVHLVIGEREVLR